MRKQTRVKKSGQSDITASGVAQIPVNGHGVPLKSGLAKIYNTPGLVGGGWMNKRTGEVLFRPNDERCIPLKVIIYDYDANTGCISVKADWLREEEQADLRDYIADRARAAAAVAAVEPYNPTIETALNLMPQEVPTEGKVGSLFVWKQDGRLYYHNGNGWYSVNMDPAFF